MIELFIKIKNFLKKIFKKRTKKNYDYSDYDRKIYNIYETEYDLKLYNTINFIINKKEITHSEKIGALWFFYYYKYSDFKELNEENE